VSCESSRMRFWSGNKQELSAWIRPQTRNRSWRGTDGQEEVDVLEEILTKVEAADGPELGPVDKDWARRVLQQATKVSCMALEICNNSAKAKWQPCAYSKYRWLMEQEVRHLSDWYSGPEEEEAPVHTPKRARMWLVRVHKDVERARDRIGLHLQGLAGKDKREIQCGPRSWAAARLPARELS
jgi:hypothetical protein